MPLPQYMKRYFQRLAYFITAYAFFLIVLLMAVALTIRVGGAVPDWVPFALALATAAPICGLFWTIFRLLEDCDDEYQRMLLMRQTLLATASTLVIVTAWQSLALFELVRQAPQLIGVLWIALFGLAMPIVRWRA
jgi:hypothetical protein